LKPAKFWNKELVKFWNLRHPKIRNLELAKSGICEVRGTDEDLIRKPEQAVIFVRKRFGSREGAKSKTSSQKSGFEV
jgi:hypothetical protein